MRGRVPARPLGEVADAAVRVFTDKGFGRAGISDVAAALGLSHGALYTYVRSKQALLYLALVRVVRPDAVDSLATPVADPAAEDVIALADGWATTRAVLPALGAAGDEPAMSVAEEFGGVVDELYDLVSGNRLVLQLVERCSAELPELAQWYFVGRRREMLAQLGDYLARRIESGHLAAVPDVPVAARYIVETIAWFAMHRHGDPDSAMLDDAACRRTVTHLLRTSFLGTTGGQS